MKKDDRLDFDSYVRHLSYELKLSISMFGFKYCSRIKSNDLQRRIVVVDIA